METKRDYLISSYNTHKNRYHGVMEIKENHIDIYKSFIKCFMPIKFSDTKEYIFSLCTRDSVVIKPFKCYVLFIDKTFKMDTVDINNLRFGLVQNFLNNWKPYSEYIYSLYQEGSNPNKLTVGEIDSSTLYNRTFNPTIIPDELYYCHILTLYVTPKDNTYRKGLYNQCIRDIIQDRYTKGLITIIIFRGNQGMWNWTKIEDELFGIDLVKFQNVGSSINLVGGNEDNKKEQPEGYVPDNDSADGSAEMRIINTEMNRPQQGNNSNSVIAQEIESEAGNGTFESKPQVVK